MKHEGVCLCCGHWKKYKVVALAKERIYGFHDFAEVITGGCCFECWDRCQLNRGPCSGNCKCEEHKMVLKKELAIF